MQVGYYMIFNNVILIGLLNLVLALYESKDLQVGDKIELADKETKRASAGIRASAGRNTMANEDIWGGVNTVPVVSQSTSTSPGFNSPNGRNNNGDFDSDSDHGEQLELV